MLQRSLTAKVLVAVGITVAGVIAIYTYFVIRVQSAWWHERTQAQNLIAATMVHEYLNGVMLSDRHEELQGFLAEMKRSKEVSIARIIKTDGMVAFSTDTQEVQRVHMNVPPELFGENRVVQGVRVEGNQRFAVAMRPVAANDSCRRCHTTATKDAAIGAIVLERSFGPAEASIASNRNVLIGYGVAIFVLVGIVIWLLVQRLVTQPVGDLLQQMQQVQSGNLRVRADVDSTDEIGQLATGFNAMVHSLDTATSELHEAHEKQIQQASKLASIGELASGIAHEIRNPLAGISAAVEVLSDDTGSSQHREVIGEIRAQIVRLNRTLHDLLEFARLREPEITPCDLREIIRPMISLVRPDAQKHHVQIVERLSDASPFISADAQQVQQAILNILINGVQAMPDGGTLTVAADAGRIVISDTGVGISEKHLARIFSPFFTTKHRGTGLGLAITRSIVEKHGGTISVESREGTGTTFTVQFTVCEPEVLSHATN